MPDSFARSSLLGAPAGRVRAALRAVGPNLGRGLVLAPLAKRTALRRVGTRLGRAWVECVGALGAAGGEDRPQAGELVDADLGGSQDAGGGDGFGGVAGVGTLGWACGSISGLIRSSGSGKTIVEELLTPISTSVCR